MNRIYLEMRYGDEVVDRINENLSYRPYLAALQFRLIMVKINFNSFNVDTIYGRLEDAEQQIVMQKTFTNRQKPLPRRCEITL